MIRSGERVFHATFPLPVLVALLAAGCGPEFVAGADHLGGEVGVWPDRSADGVARIRKGPLVQDVGPAGATFVWETDLPARSLVEIEPEGAPAAAASGARRVASGRTYRVNFVRGLDWFEPEDAFVHEVRVGGLLPRTTYRYRITSATGEAGGTFKTAPAGPADFTAVLFGDNRGAAARFGSVIAAARASRPELVLATGDLVGTGSSDDDWQLFFDVGAALLRDVPFYTTLGNHDVYKYGIPLFSAYFASPLPAIPYAVGKKYVPDAECVYSFDWGRAHFVMLNSNRSGTVALQAEWLKKDLAAARARGAAPVVAFMHHPLFTAADHEPALELREAWWAVLRDGGVDAVIAGHNHVYERFDIDGRFVVTSGGAGAPTYDIDGGIDRPEAKLRKAASEKLHVIRLDVKATGAFEATVLDAEGGVVLDRFAGPAR